LASTVKRYVAIPKGRKNTPLFVVKHKKFLIFEGNLILMSNNKNNIKNWNCSFLFIEAFDAPTFEFSKSIYKRGL